MIGDPFAGNMIPQSRLNPTSTAIIGLVPAAEFRRARRAGAQFLLPAGAVSPIPIKGDIRVDQTVSTSNNLYARFSISENSQPAVGAFPGFIGGGTSSINDAAQGVLSDIHIFSPTLVNEFRFGYVRHNGSINGTGQDGAAFALQHNVALFPAPILGFPNIVFNYSGQLSGTSEFSGWGGGDPNLNIENRFQWADNVSWTHGKHAVKFGVGPPPRALRHRERHAVLRPGDLWRDVHFEFQRARFGPAPRRFPAGLSQFHSRHTDARLGTPAQHLFRRLRAGRLED